MKKNVITCIISDPQLKEKILDDLPARARSGYEIIFLQDRNKLNTRMEELERTGSPARVFIIDLESITGDITAMPASFQEIDPRSLVILLCAPGETKKARRAAPHLDFFRIISIPWEPENLQFTVRRAVEAVQAEEEQRKHAAELRKVKENAGREKRLMDKLSGILNEKIEELEDHRQELEQMSKELNVTTIEKILIEQEAGKMNKTLSSLKNSLKNNLFVRSVLHSIVNILQIQFSIDRRENSVIGQLKDRITDLLAEIDDQKYNALSLKKELNDISMLLSGKLSGQRKKTELNLHRTLFGYVKAVQRTLMGETVHFTSRPCYLPGVLKKVREKYREILENETAGKRIDFIIDLHTPDIYLKILDFSLINIMENLLTNSIRKLFEDINRGEKWIKITSHDEQKNNQEFTVINWMDNGPGIEEQRKKSIFEGDSDKIEEGDHGIGLSDIKTTIEAVGGYIYEAGEYGSGAEFVLGFPKVYNFTEIDYDEDINDNLQPAFSPPLTAKKILIVEDETEILDSYLDFFKGCGMEEVIGVDDGKQALDLLLLHNFRPDLIITDIDMKDLDGFTLLEQLKHNGYAIPTIVVSGILFQKSSPKYTQIRRLERLGVKEILEKPLDFKLLFELVKKYLSAPLSVKDVKSEKK
jgi:CheY-like chemotaxis protein/signal transduction histidine kinase